MNATVLEELRDIDGVVGSFVISAQGEPLLRDLPNVVHDEALRTAGTRITRLVEAFAEQGPVDGCLLRYSDHRLAVRSAGSHLLCVLSSDATNQPTLNMGMTLVARRVAAMKLDEVAASPTPQSPALQLPAAEQSSSSVPAAAPKRPAESSGRRMMYRGQPIR